MFVEASGDSLRRGMFLGSSADRQKRPGSETTAPLATPNLASGNEIAEVMIL